MPKWICKKCKDQKTTCTIKTTEEFFDLPHFDRCLFVTGVQADFVQVESKKISKE